ncbi:RNA polymerase III transcription factor subunit, putative [Talaromyces stipitatus ATCC 10500]|uniref:RNA polymerase III transcription factor subunit, putative n=1 Tax=Talaromyces stipitatus (strain ATCC 10500 / CBS 375.48 / QM 6759 / NRRL 1006) TaxID=441959 RepID=B8MAS3_TALSN|nr:RNA polymerase III transcription factor subunit, putative [Talaromyces stipitatus ATCC 10500]EED17763.1 RNA polymerase III transcription factor subunit, putative [Talaromyces stipitatus ATCC 10500]
MAEDDELQYAPWYRIPSRRIVAVEHPGIVKNVDRAIKTLQSDTGISKILDPSKPGSKVQLCLRPEDPMASTIDSSNRQTDNILLKVTVPKWTGGKRKRGSDEPFSDGPPSTPEDIEKERQSCAFRQRSLMDNAHRYSVEPVGTVTRTHNFRKIPDYVYSTAKSPFVQKFRETILPFEYEKMRKFDISMSRGETKNVDLIPPPAFTKTFIPFQYTYRQNPTVKLSQDTSGNVTAINTQMPNKVFTHLVTCDVPEVPSEPREGIPPISSLDPDLQNVIATVQKLFEERLAWTRRALLNAIPGKDQRYVLKYAISYVGYIFRSGPWRDAIVKLGHDPRKDVESRKYQTFVFRILAREPEIGRDGGGSAKQHQQSTTSGSSRGFSGLDISSIPTVTHTENPNSHLWTGKAPLALDGKIWMVCDIVDPILKQILYPPNADPNTFLRSECEIFSDGWYGSGTIAKVKVIMRQKIHALSQEHREPSDAEYECLLGFPDHVTEESGTRLEGFHLDAEKATPRETMLATEVRATIKGAISWRRMMAGQKVKTATTAATTTTTASTSMETAEDEEEREATRRVIEEEEEEDEEEEEEEVNENEDNDDMDVGGRSFDSE